MYKIKIVLINLIMTSLLGALMQFVWAAISGCWEQLSKYNIINMMSISAIIGSICLSALFYITLKIRGSIIKALLINTILVIILCTAVYLETGIFFSNWNLDAKWIIIIVLAISGTIIMTTHWYKRISYYNSMLELKKASLKAKDDNCSIN